MRLIALLVARAGPAVGRVIAASIGGGVLAAGIVSAANSTLVGPAANGSLARALLYLLALAAMLLSATWAARTTMRQLEAVQVDLRARLVRALERAPLRQIEALGPLPGRALSDLMLLGAASPQLIGLMQQVAFVLAITLVIAAVSAHALVFWLVAVGFIARRFRVGLAGLPTLHDAQSQRVGALHDRLTDFVAGYAQLKFDPAAERAVVAELGAARAAMFEGRDATADHVNRMALGATVIFFGLGYGLVVFPTQEGVGLDPIVSYDVTILMSLSLGPLFRLLQGVPALVRANASVEGVLAAIDALEAQVDAPAGVDGGHVEALRYAGLTFAYGPHFAVGPVDLCLEPGQLTLVTGGNGSGKTTLMKMLIGLYPAGGRVVWNGRPVHPRRLAAYRGLFTAVFDDGYLFDRAYGLGAPPERVEALLERFGIDHVVPFDDGRFGRLELSAGQRMRLAMVVALLEDRPVLVFDEWTAHQDPETTQMYYDVLLPELAAAGKVVVAVSHDRRYFGRADQRIVLDGGRVVVSRG